MTHVNIRNACKILFSPGQTVEVRAQGKRGIASGSYDGFDPLADLVYTLDKSGEYKGIYVTLNPVNPISANLSKENYIPHDYLNTFPTSV